MKANFHSISKLKEMLPRDIREQLGVDLGMVSLRGFGTASVVQGNKIVIYCVICLVLSVLCPWKPKPYQGDVLNAFSITCPARPRQMYSIIKTMLIQITIIIIITIITCVNFLTSK